MKEGVQRLVQSDEPAALEFLDRAPFENVFLSWLIVADRSPVTRSALYGYADRAQAICGVGFFGRQIVLATQEPEAIQAFAKTAQAHRFERMIVGPRAAIEPYWARVRPWHTPPRAVRESQPVMALEHQHLRGSSGDLIVRRAVPAEWRSVADNSAAMISQELEYDPRPLSEDFCANVRVMIERGLWWIGERGGELCFFCNAGPQSPRTLQLQGIWTPPHLRRRGLATAALYGICERLLGEAPSLCLYVNAFNIPAIALYDRIGFRRVGEFMSLLF